MSSPYAGDPTRERIAAIISELAPIPAEQLEREMSLVDDLGYDSLAVVELMLEFERVFELPPLPEDSAAEAVTVSEVVEFLLPHLEQREHA